MPFFDENKDTINIALVVVGIIIVLYFLIPHIINAKVLAMQVNDLREEVRELRKFIMKNHK